MVIANEKRKIPGKWGTWIIVKENAPELAKWKYVKGSVWMISLSDPYQPIERKLKLTKKFWKTWIKELN